MSIQAMLPAVLLLIAASLTACDTGMVEQLQFQKVTYADDVEPIMQKHCAECHVAGRQGADATGFLVDSYESVMHESRFGPVVDPGSAKTSSLYNLVSADDHLTIRMPHGKDPLSAEEIETIRVWIDNGAVKD